MVASTDEWVLFGSGSLGVLSRTQEKVSNLPGDSVTHVEYAGGTLRLVVKLQ